MPFSRPSQSHRACLLRLGALVGLALTALAPPVRGQVTACDPSMLDPFPPLAAEPLLDRYYVATDGVGGRGCWVHRHSNGRDVVVTPHGWGERPSAGHRAYIGAVMDAITASRATYERLGNLDIDLGYLLSDVHRGFQEAYWPVDGQCWMEGAAETWGSLDIFRQVVAHEIGHCFLMKEGLWTPESYAPSVHKWLDESGAEFLGSEVYPATDDEFRHEYDIGSPMQQPYAAHVLFRQYANEHGVPAALALIHALAPARFPVEQLSLLRSAGYTAEEFLETLMRHRYSGVRDPGGGTIPNGSLGEWKPDLLLTESSEEAALPPIDGILLTMVQVVVPAGFDARLFAPSGGSHDLAAIVDFGPGMDPGRLDASGVPVGGSCTDVADVPLRLTHLHDTPATGAVVRYTLTERSCDEEASVDPGRGVIGTWYASRGSILSMFSQVFGDALPVRAVTGDVVLTLTEAGQATLLYQNVRVFFDQERENPPPIPSVVIRGGGELTWRGGSPGQIVFDGQSFSFEAVAGRLTLPMDDSGFPLGRTVVSYGFVDTTLVFMGFSGHVFFPNAWTRR